MKKTGNVWRVISAVFFMLFLVCTCITGYVYAENSNMVNLWGSLSSSDAAFLEELLHKYTIEGHGGVIFKNFTSEEELKQALLTGDPHPDVAIINTKWIPLFESSIVPMEDLMNSVGSTVKVVAKMDTFPSVYERCQKNKRLLTAPFSANAYALLYNEKLFQQAGVKKLPVTWLELSGAAKQILAKKPGFWGFVLPVAQGPAFMGEFWGAMLHSQGGTLLDAASGKTGAFSRLAISTLQYFWDMVNKDKVASVTGVGETANLARQAAMMVGDVYTLEKLRQVEPGWKAAFLPKGKTRPLVMDVLSLAVFKQSSRNSSDLYQSYSKAWELVHYLTEFPQAKEWALHTSSLPVNKQVYLSPYYISMLQKEKPWLKTYIGILTLPPAFLNISPDEGQTYHILGNEIMGALRQERTVQESLNRAKNEMSKQRRKEGSNLDNILKKMADKIPGRVGISVKGVNGYPLFLKTPMNYLKLPV